MKLALASDHLYTETQVKKLKPFLDKPEITMQDLIQLPVPAAIVCKESQEQGNFVIDHPDAW